MAILKEKVGLTKADLKKLQSMRPGMSIDVQFKTPNSTRRVKTEFVGMDTLRSVIIKFPDENKWGNVGEGIYVDNSVIIRYILEEDTGEVIAFKSKVTFMLSKPGNLVFLSFPLAIQNMDLRSEQRQQIRIATRLLHSKDHSSIGDAVIMDLSTSGCRIGMKKERLKKKLSTQDVIVIRVKAPDQSDVDIQGELKNQRTEDGLVYFGIKFVKSAEVMENLLHELQIAYE
jgi:hypothetical protein